MTPEVFKTEITSRFPSVTFEENTESPVMLVAAADFRNLMQTLHDDDRFAFGYLFCVTCVDWKDHFQMVYHLRCPASFFECVVKVKLTDTDNPILPTVSDIWKGAALQECEAYDFFGVHFSGHPNLRRIFLTPDWKGFPMRKNYEDVNMIRL